MMNLMQTRCKKSGRDTMNIRKGNGKRTQSSGKVT
jgi:hypothetical protein